MEETPETTTVPPTKRGRKAKAPRKPTVRRVRPIVIQKWIADNLDDPKPDQGRWQDVDIPDDDEHTTAIDAMKCLKKLAMAGQFRVVRLLATKTVAVVQRPLVTVEDTPF
jgi:hypothetical protein